MAWGAFTGPLVAWVRGLSLRRSRRRGRMTISPTVISGFGHGPCRGRPDLQNDRFYIKSVNPHRLKPHRAAADWLGQLSHGKMRLRLYVSSVDSFAEADLVAFAFFRHHAEAGCSRDFGFGAG